MTGPRTRRCDLAVIGGGILGLSIGALAARRGYEVIVVRRSDLGRPRADSLRNQGWLQSGLMYIDHFREDRSRGRVLAARMYAAGLDMLRALGIAQPPRSECGVVRVRNDDEAERLVEDAASLRIAGVSLLEAPSAAARLGGIYEDGVYISIPDVPFPEAEVLMRLREEAHRYGATILQLDAPTRLVADASSACGLRIECEQRSIEPDLAVAAAGAGNVPLLASLGLAPRMTLRQTPLLVLHETLDAETPIFADRARSFSFVRHPPDGSALPHGALVVGTAVHREVDFREPELRRIHPDDRERFVSYLPEPIESRLALGRFTAGFECIPSEEVGKRYMEPWVERVEEFPRLICASPGRATLALAVGREVLQKIELDLGEPRESVRAAPTEPLWDDPIHMHFHSEYSYDDSVLDDEEQR